MSTNLDWDLHIITTCIIVRQTLGHTFSKISHHDFEVLQSVTQIEELFLLVAQFFMFRVGFYISALEHCRKIKFIY